MISFPPQISVNKDPDPLYLEVFELQLLITKMHSYLTLNFTFFDHENNRRLLRGSRQIA